jgi:hypothetical protein
VISLLSNFVADKYLADVKQNHCIKNSNGKKIMGMALDTSTNKLFVVDVKESVTSYPIPSDVEQRIVGTVDTIPGLKWPRGIAIGQLHNSLYIIDWTSTFSGTLWIYRLANGGILQHAFNVQPFGVAVLENETNVEIFVTCATPITGSGEQIIVLSDDGKSIRETSRLILPSSFQIPRYAIPLRGANDGYKFVVCHGWTFWRYHRVSLVRQAVAQTIYRRRQRMERKVSA